MNIYIMPILKKELEKDCYNVIYCEGEKMSKMIDDFVVRVKNKPEPIDNGSLHAGSPMYYYCKWCGHNSDVLPEGSWASPSHVCGACQKLIDLELMEKAVDTAE